MKGFYIACILFFPFYCSAQNYPPVANDDFISLYPGTTIGVNPKLNDSDPNNNFFQLDTFFYYTGKGTVTRNGPYLMYSADSFFYDKDTIFYVICDVGTPVLCDTGAIYISMDFKFYDRFENLDTNNISARINSGGINFSANVWESKFEAPKGSSLYSILSQSICIGGEDDTNGLHLAAQRYYSGQDFIPGPVMDSVKFISASEYYEELNSWNRLWKVNKAEIDYHVLNWNQPGYTVPQILIDWPAHGDTVKGQSYYLAPFHDSDNDGLYNPALGDYPLIKGDQCIFYLINDNLPHGTMGVPMKVEIHCSAYSFNCTADSALQNTVFINYQFINRSFIEYSNSYLAVWVEGDIGGPNDDYIACDVQKGSFFFYNGDDVDSGFGANGYGDFPPAQSITFLAGPKKDWDNKDNPLINDYYIAIADGGIPYSGLGWGYGDGIMDNERFGMTSFAYNNGIGGSIASPPFLAKDYYNYMKGLWKDGSPMSYGGSGLPYSGSEIAQYTFPGNSDPLGWGTSGISQLIWNEITAGNSPGDRKGIASSGPFTFEPGETEELDLAFVFGRDYSLQGAAAGVANMRQRIDAIRAMFINDSTPCGGKFSVATAEIDRKESELNLYPNPAETFLIIKTPATNAFYIIYDLMGKKVIEGEINSSTQPIKLKGLMPGMYFAVIMTNEKNTIKKIASARFIKN